MKALLIAVSVLMLSCATMVKKEELVVETADATVSFGAAMIALPRVPYLIKELTPDRIVTENRYTGTRNELMWNIVVAKSGNKLVVDTTTVDGEGRIHKKIQKYLENVRAEIAAAQTSRPVADLTKLATHAGEVQSIEIQTASPPSSCKAAGSVSATVSARDASLANMSAKELLRMEALLKDANYVALETSNTLPAFGVYKFTVSGTAYQCPVRKRAHSR